MKLLIKYIHFYASGGPLNICVKIDSFSMSYSLAFDNFSHEPLPWAKIKSTCWRTLKPSIGTITNFSRSSDSSCMDSWTAGQRMSGVLPERLQPGGVALSTLRAPFDRLCDRLSSPCNVLSCCQNFFCVKMVMVPMEGLSVLKHVHSTSLHPKVICAKTFQMQSCTTPKTCLFLFF